MAQTRVVLKDPHNAIAAQIMEATKLSNLSEVVGAMLTRYGRHMMQTWQLDAGRCPDPAPDLSAPTLPLAGGQPVDNGEALEPLTL